MKIGRIVPVPLAAVLLAGCTGAAAHGHTATPPATASVPAATATLGAPAATVADIAPASTTAPAPTASPAAAMPNPALTPGDVFPSATAQQVCMSGYARSVRSVSAEEKRHVYDEYGIDSHAYGSYEVDHLVPLELGGSNDIKNLWPQPAIPVPGFHEKDDLENRLHDLVCGGQIGLGEAQHAIAVNWLAAYWQYIGGITR